MELTPEKYTIKYIFSQLLISDFYPKPKIGILSLNPHGATMTYRNEEKALSYPLSKQQQILTYRSRPFRSGLFGSNDYKKFVALIQCTTPRYITFQNGYNMEGVNYTAGLSIIRTSQPRTAYYIAGLKVASPYHS
jgi:4-hydroxy-L-threonine phosphate dehydrogenase PdxA